MLLGTSENVPIHKGRLMLGTWQSLIMVGASVLLVAMHTLTHVTHAG